MKPRRHLVHFLLLSASALTSSGADWKDEINKQLRLTYSTCKIGSDFNTIAAQGTALEIQKDGVDGDIADNVSVPVTIVEGGQLHPAGGFTGLLRDEKSTRPFKIGDKVCLHEFSIRNSENIFLNFISLDKVTTSKSGTTQQVRYKGILRFQFPKDYLKTADFQSVKQSIMAVIAPPSTSVIGPKTISAGSTLEQVEKVFGKPEKIVTLGPKTIYVYKDLKVTFDGGRVSDVE